MSLNRRYSDYDDFAWVYNRHWGKKFTPIALAVLEKFVLPRLSRDSRILDLCCGTGQLAHALSERGYVVSGIDGSEKMLRFARKNAPSTRFILSDARTFKLPDTFDAVVSMFDSLNHIMTLNELMIVFRNVYNCLKDGGLFLFDMNLEFGYLTNWQGCYGIVEDDHVCIFPNSYDHQKRVGQIDFTIFRFKRNWWRSDFKLTQKCYTNEQIHSRLKKTGFAIVEAFSLDKNGKRVRVTRKSKRSFFLCQKLIS